MALVSHRSSDHLDFILFVHLRIAYFFFTHPEKLLIKIHMRKQALIVLILALGYSTLVSAQTSTINDQSSMKWALQQYNQMTLDEKIGQLFMVSAYSGGKNMDDAGIRNLIKNYHIGGLIFMQGSVSSQIALQNTYQSLSKLPLLIAMDAEWGIGMRMKEVTDIAKNIQIGATYDAEIAREVGRVIAEQCKRLGVHINFGPVVDINNNPDNPVINFRSFGENKNNVTKLGSAYARGQEGAGVMACAKHFPGHGDTDVDSHKDLPQIKKSMNMLWENELYPFRNLVDDASSMMIAHLTVPAITNSSTLPTTLSYDCITGLLKQRMGYQGLIFTDALNMQGVAKYYKPGEVDYKAFMAGNDVLLFSQSVPKAVALIKQGVQNGSISEVRLRTSVLRILEAKHRFGAVGQRSISSSGATADLNRSVSALNTKIAEASITLCKDDQNLFKQKTTSANKVLYVSLGSMSISKDVIQNKGIKTISINPKLSTAQMRDYIKSWASYERVILGVHGVHKYPKGRYGLSSTLISTANYLASHSKNAAILVNGNPYAIKYFCEAPSIIVNYEETGYNLTATIDAILGKIPFEGKLPVSVCSRLPEGTGLTVSFTQPTPTKYRSIARQQPRATETITQTANQYTQKNSPQYDFSRIDQMVNRYMSQRVFPGCQILIAKDGKIVHHKSYGKHIYDGRKPVMNTHVYDIASVTKIAATTLAVMKLYEEGKISLDATLGDYLSWTRGTNKADRSIRRILLHEAGLKSWIPFYKETMTENGTYKTGTLKYEKSPLYSIPVAKHLYINRDYPKHMWDEVLSTAVGGRRYVYSDLDFMFLQKVVESITGMPLDEYVEQTFYKPLRLERIGYSPMEKHWISPTYIVPTESDNYFRMQLLTGYVHDPGAAMLGGVAGHAGLFSDAYSLYVLLQMLLDDGTYSGQKFFKKSTIDLFTKYGSNISRRGLGFDKPDKSRPGGPTGVRCSSSTFGHQGFTGTCVWADPESDVVFIFLSNRVYPSADNKLISRLDVRTDLQDVAYQIMGL